MPQWIFVAIFGLIQVIIVGLVVALRAADHEKFATLEERIGDTEERTVKSIDELREWKHEKVDPYVPPVIDEHERRIERLERRVFNGGPKGKT
jgi:hypothetical protein